jgi:hypothetical protein
MERERSIIGKVGAMQRARKARTASERRERGKSFARKANGGKKGKLH